LEHRAVSVATTDAGVLGLGVDIEQEIPVEIAAGIRQEIVDAEEDALLRSYFEAYHRGLTVVFSGKESVYKAAHRLVGRSFDFASMRLVRVDANQMVFSVAEALCERLPVGVELRVNYTLLGREVFTIACLTPQDADHNSPDRAWGDFPDFLRNRDLGRTDQQRCSHRR
jgi:4'-phosphopantetheinyl transferase EntD